MEILNHVITKIDRTIKRTIILDFPATLYHKELLKEISKFLKEENMFIKIESKLEHTLPGAYFYRERNVFGNLMKQSYTVELVMIARESQYDYFKSKFPDVEKYQRKNIIHRHDGSSVKVKGKFVGNELLVPKSIVPQVIAEMPKFDSPLDVSPRLRF